MSGRFEEVQRGHLLTEQPHPRSTELDALSTQELVELFCDEDRRPQEAVAAAAPALAQAIEAISARLEALTKERMSNDCRVLLSSATKDLLEDGRWRLLAWGPQPVKGREQTVDVYELESGEDRGAVQAP